MKRKKKEESEKCDEWVKLSYDDLKYYIGQEVAVVFPKREFNPNNFEGGYIVRCSLDGSKLKYWLMPTGDYKYDIMAWLVVEPDLKNFDIYAYKNDSSRKNQDNLWKNIHFLNGGNNYAL